MINTHTVVERKRRVLGWTTFGLKLIFSFFIFYPKGGHF